MDLQSIIEHSTYTVLPDLYSVAKVNSEFDCDGVFMLSHDDIESTAIYKKGTAYKGVIEEKQDYKLIAVNVAIPFYAPGFIASISKCVANKGISVLVVSTYSRDYFIIASKDIKTALHEIEKLGIKES